MALVECVPNFSEGRRPDVVHAIRDAIAAVDGVVVLDLSMDASHNRSVITFVAPTERAVDAAFAGMRVAAAQIDLTTHQGAHPRIGATDVVPFVPLEGATMGDCVALAQALGARVASELNIPVYLYEEASANPARRNLEDIRRGEFEGLAAKMGSDGWTPDFGGPAPHPTAGAAAIGARMPLIAYNINLASDRLDVAKKIAAAVRHSSGGLRYVKAMGVMLDDRRIAQVSMNLTNYEKTPMPRVFEFVKREAARYGVGILESEIVGLVPQAALLAAAEYYLQIEGFAPSVVLENRLRET